MSVAFNIFKYISRKMIGLVEEVLLKINFKWCIYR